MMRRTSVIEDAGTAEPVTPAAPVELSAPAEISAEHSTGRSIAGAVGVQLAGRGIGTLASIITIALTTRHLGVTGYGQLTTAIVFVGVWTSLTELGVGAVIVRKVGSDRGRLASLVGTNVGLSLSYCVPLAVVAGASGLLIYHDKTSVHAVLLVVCAGLIPTAVANCFQPVFMVAVRFGAVALSEVVCRIASLLATILVIEAGGGLVWFGVVQVVPPLIQIVVLGLAARRILPFRVRFDVRTSRALLRESLPQTAVLIVGVLYWRIDAVILTLLGSTRQVGAYGIASTVAYTLSVLSTFFLASSLSTMTTRWATDREAFARFVASGMELMFFLGLPIAVFGAILARPTIALLGNKDFADVAAVPLMLLLISAALTFATGVLSQALFAAHDQGFLLRLNIANLIGNIVLNLILIPFFGAVGCAVALLVSEVSGLVITTWRLHRSSGYRNPWPFAVRLAGPLAIGAALAVLLHHVPVLITFVVVGVAYVGANLVLGPVRVGTVRRLLGREDPRDEPVAEPAA
jgi:O-antigen/teichoic acid export membrane protein